MADTDAVVSSSLTETPESVDFLEMKRSLMNALYLGERLNASWTCRMSGTPWLACVINCKSKEDIRLLKSVLAEMAAGLS